MTIRRVVSSVVLVMPLAMFLGSQPSWAAPADPQAVQGEHDHGQATPAPAGDEQMLRMRADLMAKMADMDAEAGRLADEMNFVTGNAKIRVMAALLTTLLGQRLVIDREVLQMHDQMMRHLQARMKSAASPDTQQAMKEKMASCSMMKPRAEAAPER